MTCSISADKFELPFPLLELPPDVAPPVAVPFTALVPFCDPALNVEWKFVS